MTPPATTLARNAALRRDPTQTVTLRREYARAHAKRFRFLKGAVRDGVDRADVFGIGEDPPSRPVILQERPEVRETLNRIRRQMRELQRTASVATGAARAEALSRMKAIARSFVETPGRFAFPSSAAKLEAFGGWLNEMVDVGIMEVTRTPGGAVASEAGWQQTFVRRAYVKGVSSASTKLRQAGLDVSPRFDDVERTLSLPVHQESLELLFARNLEELRGITAEMSTTIRRELAQGFAEGINPRDTAVRINRAVDGIGIRRSRTLARTETIRAHAQATLRRYRQFGIEQVQGRAEFATAGDDRVCPICLGLEGEAFTLLEAEGVIPVHPNCFPAGTLVNASDVQGVSSRRYEGILVRVRTDAGHELTGTPNHPVLTDRGWVPLAELSEGDNVIRRVRGGRGSVPGIDHQRVPSRIEDVAEAARRSGGMTTAEVPVAAPDFHGDGEGSEVAVVGTDCLLRNRVNAAGSEQLGKLAFDRGRTEALFLSGLRRLALRLQAHGPAAGGLVCRRHLGLPLLFRHLGPLQFLRLALAADVDPRLPESLVDGASGHVVGGRQGVDGFAGPVPLGDLFDRQVSPLPTGRSHLNAGPGEATVDRGAAERELLRKLQGGETGAIAFDQVSGVDVLHRFSGTVYNLETGSGIYAAEGLVVHNCRCTWLPVVPGAASRVRDTALGLNRNADRVARVLEEVRRVQEATFPDWLRRAA